MGEWETKMGNGTKVAINVGEECVTWKEGNSPAQELEKIRLNENGLAILDRTSEEAGVWYLQVLRHRDDAGKLWKIEWQPDCGAKRTRPTICTWTRPVHGR